MRQHRFQRYKAIQIATLLVINLSVHPRRMCAAIKPYNDAYQTSGTGSGGLELKGPKKA